MRLHHEAGYIDAEDHLPITKLPLATHGRSIHRVTGGHKLACRKPSAIGWKAVTGSLLSLHRESHPPCSERSSGHTTFTLIMGPGGYKFGDYWRMGLPLEVLVIVVSVPMILLVWPL